VFHKVKGFLECQKFPEDGFTPNLSGVGQTRGAILIIHIFKGLECLLIIASIRVNYKYHYSMEDKNMDAYLLNSENIAAWGRHLRQEERSPGTIEKYLRDARAFALWLGEDQAVTKERTAEWKEYLLATNHAPVTVNSKLAALNGLFRFLDWDIRLRFLKIQRRLFRDFRRELTRSDYDSLVEEARRAGKERLALLMEAICSTGIRVSEAKYLTVEAIKLGRVEISLKGKIREILLPRKLCRKLLKYARHKKIASGEIFLTKSGNSLSRRQIWAEMKQLCKAAGVDPAKVYPHNLRHLFAVTFYRVCRDIAKLADVLGHSSIETTRIYLITTGEDHLRQLDRLGLVS
jgi:integrase/recombinase XerD